MVPTSMSLDSLIIDVALKSRRCCRSLDTFLEFAIDTKTTHKACTLALSPELDFESDA